MLNLEELVFKVNTKELTDAVTAIEGLGTAVDNLGKKSATITTKVSQTTKAVEAQAKAAKSSAQAQEEVEASTTKSTNALQRQQDVLNFMTQGFSKGQASTLAYAKASGLAADALGELGKVLERQRTLMGTDPFDKSIGAMKALKNETTVLREVNRLYTKDLGLTKKQMEDLAREKLRIIEAGKIEGKTFSEIRAEVYAVGTAISRLAQEDNKLANQMKASQKAESDRVKSLGYIEDQLEKTNRAVAATNEQLNRSSSNSIVNFERALKKSGLTLEEQAVKLAQYKKNLQELNAAGGDRQVNYLSRALGPQITDIAVGLATGQGPLTVLLQQGGQLRDQFALAGVAGADMGKMLVTATKNMVSSIKDVGLAVGTAIVGTFAAAGSTIVDTTLKVGGLDKKITDLRNRMLAAGGLAGPTPDSVAAWDNFAKVLRVTMGAAIAVSISSLIALGVSLKQVMDEEIALSKTLNFTGASLGINRDQAYTLAQSMNSVGVSTSKAAESIIEIGKAGGFASKDIELITTTAVALEKTAGIAISDTVAQFKKLADDPVKAITELAIKTGLIAPEIVKVVTELDRSGNSAQAAAVAMTAYGEASKKAAEEIRSEYGTLELIGKTLTSTFSKMWEAILNVGRKDTLANRLAEAKEELKGIEAAGQRWWQLTKGAYTDTVKAQQEIVDSLQAQIDLQTKEGKQREQNSKVASAQADYEKQKTAALSKQDKLEAELAKWAIDGKVLIDAKIISMEDYIKQVQRLKDKYKEAKTPEDNFFENSVKQAKKLVNESIAEQEKLTKAEEFYLNLQADARWSKLSSNRKAQIVALIEEAKAQELSADRMTLREKALAQLMANEDRAAKYNKDYHKQLTLMQKALDTGAISQEEFNAQLIALEAIQPHVIKRQEEHNRAIDEYVKKVRKQDDANLDLLFAMDALNEAVDEETKALALEAKLIGQSDDERKRSLAALKAEAELKKELADINKSGASDAEREEARTAAYERFAQKIRNVNTSIAIDFEKRIREGVSDAIVTGLFEGGKAGRKKLRDLIVAELRKPITLMVNAVVNTILGSVIGDAGSSAAGSAGSSMLTSAAGNFLGGNALTGGVGMSGMSGFTSGLSAWGAGGSVSGVLANPGLYSAAELLGTVAPILLGVAAVAALIAGLDDSGTLHTGAGSSFSASGGLSKINPLGTEYGAGTQSLTDQVAQSVVGILDSTAKTFGNEAGYNAATAFADDTSKDGAWGSLVISKLGGSVLDWADTQTSRWAPKEFADGEAGAKEYMQAIATSVRDVLIEETPDWADAMLEGLGDSVTMEALAATVTQINQIQSSFEAIGMSTEGIDVAKLGALFGGVDNFISATQGFYASFATDAQKLELTKKSLQSTFDTLGIAIPESKQEFYELVTSLDLTTEAGQAAYQALIASGDAFLFVENAAVEAAASMRDAWTTILAARGGQSDAFAAQAQIDTAWSAFEATGNRFGIGAPDWFKTITYDDFQNYTTEEQQLISQILDGYAKLDKAVNQTTDSVTDSGSAADTRSTVLNAAYSALEKSVNAQIKLVQSQYDLAKAVYDVAIAAVRELRGEVSSTALMQANEGRQFIADALAQAQADGSLPDAKKLSEAISAVKSSIDSTAYATKVEQDKAKILLSNDLQALADIAGPQMTTAELQLVELQGILVTAKDQLNALLGINDSVLSVTDALTAWAAAMAGGGTTSGGTGTSTGGTTGTSGGTSSGGSGGFAGIQGGGPGETRTIEQQIADLEAAGIPYHVSNLPGAGIVVSRASSFENQHRIPGYADGGAFTNGIVQTPTMFNTAQMGEAGPEAIMPLTNVGGSLGIRAQHDPELRDAVLKLNENIEMLRTEVRADVSHNAKTARLLDRVIEDGRTISVTANIDGGVI